MKRAQSATGFRRASPANQKNNMTPGNTMTPSRKRPGTAGPTTRRSPSMNMNQSTSTPNLKGRMNNNKNQMRPHTAAAGSPSMRSTYNNSSKGGTSPGGTTRPRPHTAQAGGYKRGIRRSANGVPKYMRPTTATRTKRLYRTGQWPSGRWKMEKAR